MQLAVDGGRDWTSAELHFQRPMATLTLLFLIPGCDGGIERQVLVQRALSLLEGPGSVGQGATSPDECAWWEDRSQGHHGHPRSLAEAQSS